MKRLTALAFTVILAISLVACGGNSDTPSDNMTTTSSSETTTPSSTATTMTSEIQTESSDEGDIGSYHIKIMEADIAEDYEGKPIVVINFEFTNNDEEANSFLLATSVKAYQDGVELDGLVFMMDDSVYDAGLAQKELKTGASLVVQKAFMLASESPIEVEVTELFSFGDTPVLTKVFNNTDLSSDSTTTTSSSETTTQSSTATTVASITTTAASTTITTSNTTTTESTEPESTTAQSAETGVSWKEYLKEYEEWMDAYVEFMKKYKDNPSDMTILAQYATMLQELAEWSEKSEQVEDDLVNDSVALAEYLQTMSRILQKLSEVT